MTDRIHSECACRVMDQQDARIARLMELLKDAADAIEVLLPDDCHEVILTESVIYEVKGVLNRLRAALAKEGQ